MNEIDEMDPMASELLALLDRIEIEEDLSLTTQRFDIAEKFGMTVKFEMEISGRMQ